MALLVQPADAVDKFKSWIFPDPQQWSLQWPLFGVPSIGENLACSCRGNLNPLWDAKLLVCHGTPLSVARKILQDGVLRVGDGGHYKNGRTVHGIFVCSEGDLFERMGHARDRSTTVGDPLWRRLGNVPCGWSCVRCALSGACVCGVTRRGAL